MMTKDSKERKDAPVHSGFNAYFPDAIEDVARLSQTGNDKHNPGEPLHWSRDKSDDHADCIARHQLEYDQLDDDGYLHATKVAWRAMAQLQVLLEQRRPKVVMKTGEWVDMPAKPQDGPTIRIVMDDGSEPPTGTWPKDPTWTLRAVGAAIGNTRDGMGVAYSAKNPARPWCSAEVMETLNRWGAQEVQANIADAKGKALRAWEEYYDLEESK